MAEYSYNPNGTVRRKQVGNSLITEYTYDRDQTVTGIRTTFGQQLLKDNQYRYNRNGMCLEKQTLQGRYTYAYDSQNRLTLAKTPKAKESYDYDGSGNRLWQKINGNEKSISRQYEYDNCNRLVKEVTRLISGKSDTTEHQEYTKHYTYDKQGNLLSDGNLQYTYDGFNRMVKAEDVQGNIQKNRYDAEGLRYEMEENERLFRYVYDEREIITEETGQDTIRYIRGYDLISSDSERARTYYHYASDELGSITQVVNGNVQRIENVYEYDSFGNTVYAEENVHNPFRYTGQQYDSLTGLYYLRARFYNPATARFTQEDSYYGDGLNLYTYCNNNPVNYYDPEGHEKLCPKGYIKKILNGKDVEKMTSKQKGNFGELLADYKMKYSSFLKAKGYDLKNINSGRVPQGLNDKIVKGIDGIYMNKNKNSPIRFVIDEAKFGKSQLGKVKGNIKQMSDQWIKSRILKAVGGDEKLEKKIIEAFKNKQVDRVLTKINKNGEVVTYKLDSYGNIIGEWP